MGRPLPLEHAILRISAFFQGVPRAVGSLENPFIPGPVGSTLGPLRGPHDEASINVCTHKPQRPGVGVEEPIEKDKPLKRWIPNPSPKK